MTGRRHAGGEREEAILTEGLEGRQGFPVRVSTRRRKSYAEPLQRLVLVRLEGSQKQARRVIAMIADRRIGTDRAIGHAVEHADLISDPALDDVAANLITDVALRNQQGRQSALDETGVVVALQALQSDRGLELSRPDLEPGDIVELDVGLVNGRGPSPEIGPDEVIDVLVDRSVKRRTNAAQHDGVNVG